ncbi:MAG: sigma 54-interacting transcriptional regulator [Desulfatiglans sp.]|nr:sigma 54-interacting transcriptional regulator [Thermodesulfobacteriota bacterium]MEE4353585.1 sigma 54-interacting transcriptional regulator [Desulfatiglans sp.]
MEDGDRDPTDLMEEGVDFDEFPEGDGVAVLSLTGRVMSANLQAERLLHRRLPRGRDLRFNEIISAEYRQEAMDAWEKALEGHSRSNLMAKVYLDSGLPVSVTFSMNPLYGQGAKKVIGVLLTLRDQASTQPKRPDRWREPVWEYDSLFEHLAEGIFTVNNRWRITSFNRRAQEITGFRREEVLGRNCWDIFRSDLCKSNCPLKITMETGVLRMDQDVRIVDKGGHSQSILVNTSVIKNKRGLVMGAVESFRPIAQVDPSEESGVTLGERPHQIVGKSPGLNQVLSMLPDVAASDATVLIEGESGTGKELIAKAIHAQSPRARGPFVAVNCSALAETLLESELFGHVKAAFTGALSNRVGRFELAKSGTLFLDEVGEIKPEIQIKLLRVLEERVFERVGGTRQIRMDSRIIAATNKRLAREVARGRFREDLYYRLRTVPISIPPLRERVSDIPLLIDHFLTVFNRRYKKSVRGVDPKVLRLFRRYAWPGNVRELEHALEHAFVFVKGPIITVSHLPEFESPQVPKTDGPPPSRAANSWEDEKITLKRALEKTQGRRDAAAYMLGISRSTLWRKMKSHGLI